MSTHLGTLHQAYDLGEPGPTLASLRICVLCYALAMAGQDPTTYRKSTLQQNYTCSGIFFLRPKHEGRRQLNVESVEQVHRDYLYCTSTMTTSGPETSVKLFQREYCGIWIATWVATETGATLQ